jgi:YbdK family carboxylate-amine ligase
MSPVTIEFHGSPEPTLGVEWELQLVDTQTRELRPVASELLAELAAPHGGEHPKLKNELLDNTVEVITGICADVPGVRADLEASVAELTAAARRRGLALACAGSHPTTDWATQQVTPSDRYRQLMVDLQWLARRMQIFGVHVHVGVRSADRVVPIVNHLATWVPHLLALSASSPYWVGKDTGLASVRSQIFGMLPTAGLPLPLDDWAGFEELLDALIATGTVSSIKEVWWDVRPHPDFGTVEIRACDGLSTLDEVCAVAALCQCLVVTADRVLEDGGALATLPAWVLRENKWRAARYGLDAELITAPGGTTARVGELLLAAVEELKPVAVELGCADDLARLGAIVRTGGSYARQRAVAEAAGGDLTAVVDHLVAEFAAGSPLRRRERAGSTG